MDRVILGRKKVNKREVGEKKNLFSFILLEEKLGEKKNLRGIESHVLFLSLKFSRKLPVEKKMVYVYSSAPMLLPLMRGTFFFII